MGLNSSKQTAAGPSSSGAVVRRCRSSRSRVLKPFCLRSHHSDCDETQISDCPNEENGKSVVNCCPSECKSGCCPVSAECYGTDEDEPSNDTNCVNSDIQLRDWGEASFTNAVSEEGNTSRDFSTRPLNPPSRFLSRFNLNPGNLSFRLTRSSSLATSRSYRASSTGLTIPKEEEENCVGSSDSLVSRSDRTRGCEFFPGCFPNRPPRMRDENSASNSSFEDHDHPPLSLSRDGLRNRNDAGVECNPSLFSPINHINSDGAGMRHAERRFSTREPAERNVRFSRTLSVGRLRDRVLRRTTAADFELYHFPQTREDRLARHSSGRHGLGHPEVEESSDDNNLGEQTPPENAPSSFSNMFYGSRNHAYNSPRARETRYRDLLEHRSNFLERRRRIRSQVRALQRLGSRFENMSGHERSCILSGQHRTGHCTCCISAREGNSNEDANARASISRIVMLAEALFEVLDEIHQQSVVLSSRPSVSPIGSIPAPNEVVESLPLKTFSKLKRKPSEDAAQCYICLVEYDEGDSMRVLPCCHDFHQACVDKWLKEIHRVCPLCRGDICHPNSFASRS